MKDFNCEQQKMSVVSRLKLRAVSCFCLFVSFATGFRIPSPSHPYRTSASRPQHVFDISKELTELDRLYSSNYGSNDCPWRFGLLEEKDMPTAVELSMKSFFKPRLYLNTEGMSGFEAKIASGAINAFTAIERFDSQISNYIGFKSRSGRRLTDPYLKPSKDSIILVAVDKGSQKICGLVEVSLELPDGNMAPPIAKPWRRPPSASDYPYLCNLCIDNSHRRKGLGRSLVLVSERIMKVYWEKSTM
jgi:ribosomal protein S18 acetylase RimI-like enzyme